MAANRVGRRVKKVCSNQSPSRAGGGRDPGQSVQRRQARVTVKYNRKELQRRLDVEKWIDSGLDELYRGRDVRIVPDGSQFSPSTMQLVLETAGNDVFNVVQEEEMPEEVNIDELLDLKTDEERKHRLQLILHSCNISTEVFISELVFKLQGLQKQEDLYNDGINLPQLHIYPTRSGSADREVLH